MRNLSDPYVCVQMIKEIGTTIANKIDANNNHIMLISQRHHL